MKGGGGDETVIERLNAALEADALPKAAHDYARHLTKRLSQPVRVSVLGPPGSGKSQLINMFMGQALVPPNASLPTTEYAYGDVAQMIVTGADGAVVRVHGTDVAALAGRSAAFLRIELPIPILQRVNLLEVVTDGTAEELISGVDWVVRRTDIALWCTQAFDANEQAVWRRVPDSLKDHAFLVLTKADKLSAEQKLSERVSSLETVVAEEFHSLFAVASLQAIRAHDGDVVDEAMFHASGGGALTSEVLRHAERGRRADFDSAHMFLARYKVETEAKRRPSKPVLQAVPDTPPEPANVAAPVAKTPKPAAPKPVAAAAVPDSAASKVENVALFADAVRFLKRRGESLSEAAEKLSEGEAKELLDSCVSGVDHLIDLFSQDESGCEAADDFIDELVEAQELMILMQVEDGDGPAADAVTLLLQLRRDMEMRLAA